MFRKKKLDWHKNSDLRSEVGTDIGLIVLRFAYKSLWHYLLSR